MVFQDPLSSLHPYYRVGWQIVELIRAHDKAISKRAARRRAVEFLRLVGIPQPDMRVDDFPHQFSGGMRQRAMIAMAMALNPALLIADEPTTALDVTVQAQVLRVIERLQDEFDTAVILITHDLGVIAETADDVVVMYAGGHHGIGEPRHDLLPATTIPTPRDCSSPCPRTGRSGRGCSPFRPTPEPDQPALGLQVSPSMPLRDGPLREGGADLSPVEGDTRPSVGVLVAAHAPGAPAGL